MQQSIDELWKANPDTPKDISELKHLARALFVPTAQRSGLGYSLAMSTETVHLEASESPEFEFCGEYSRGLVDLTLASSLVSQSDKDEVAAIVADAQPSLEKQKTIDHFRFSWTEVSTDARDNVQEQDIDATGIELNALFDMYAQELRQPQADSNEVIDVEVYFDPGLFGSTSSFSNKIFLNSRDVVRDPCRRRTTSAHELFHRVEYAYGYQTGTPGQRWWVEALGSWSQKFAYPAEHDYVRRVEAGLSDPDKGLLTRSYDACHYWKFFGERIVAESSATAEVDAIRDFLEQHDANGHDAQAACDTVLSGIRPSRPFDSFFSDWSVANFAKDFTGVPNGYNDNEVVITNCQRTYGPYPHILPAADEVIVDDTASWTSPTQIVNEFGTDYFRFRLGSGVTQLTLRFEGNSGGGAVEFAVGRLTTKGEDWRSSGSEFSTGVHERTIDVTAEDVDGVVVAISAVSGGSGEYVLKINP